MANAQFITLMATGVGLFFTMLALQIGAIYFLSSRIDGMSGRIDGLSNRIDAMSNRLDGRIDRIGDDLRQFHRTMGQHDIRLDAIEKHPS